MTKHSRRDNYSLMGLIYLSGVGYCRFLLLGSPEPLRGNSDSSHAFCISNLIINRLLLGNSGHDNITYEKISNDSYG